MKRYIIALLLLGGGITVSAQSDQHPSFSSPFDFPLVLSGNFGEIRSNHFHGGLDFKTQGVSGKKLMALGNGYISRIRVTHGSGYVLHVTYDNGYTTINRHLQGFVPPISQRVEDLQYEKESWQVDITPEPDEYPVTAGQQIARSGNTGYSFGPHLHLDVFENETDDSVDPLPFFKNKIKDSRPPVAFGFMLFPQMGKGAVNGSGEIQTIELSPKTPIEVWGEIGSGIRAYDYSDGANNRCGVHTVIFSVDGEEVFRSTVDRFSSYENRMINSWTEGQYMKSFIEPGNTMRMLEAKNGNRGIITIDEERDYQLSYVLKDAYGNTSRYNYTIRGKKQDIPEVTQKEKYIFVWNKVNYLKEPGLDLLIPRGNLYDNVALNYHASADSGSIAFTYTIHDKRVPLHTACDIQIGLLKMPVADTTKYYMARVNDKGKWIYVGGKYENGFIKARIRELGTYTLGVDTIPPTVTPINPQKWAQNGKVAYKVKEEETDIQSYRGTIDGEYALFGLNIMNNQLVCELNSRRVKRGKKHVVELTVTDSAGNETIVTDTFTW